MTCTNPWREETDQLREQLERAQYELQAALRLRDQHAMTERLLKVRRRETPKP